MPKRALLLLWFAQMSFAAVAEGGAELLRALDHSGRTLASKKCDRPTKVRIETVQNRHDPTVADEIKTYYCPQFTVQVYVAYAAGIPQELPMQLTLGRKHPTIPKSFSIGSSATAIRSALGQPYRSSGHHLVYSTNSEMPGSDTIAFQIKANRVEALQWRWEVD